MVLVLAATTLMYRSLKLYGYLQRLLETLLLLQLRQRNDHGLLCATHCSVDSLVRQLSCGCMLALSAEKLSSPRFCAFSDAMKCQ